MSIKCEGYAKIPFCDVSYFHSFLYARSAVTCSILVNCIWRNICCIDDSQSKAVFPYGIESFPKISKSHFFHKIIVFVNRFIIFVCTCSARVYIIGKYM